MNAETLVSSLCNWLRRVFGRERESETDPLASAERKKKVPSAFHMKAAHCEGWMRSDGLDMHVNGKK